MCLGILFYDVFSARFLAFLNFSKSLSAWYDDLVNGDEATRRNPFERPIFLYSSNSSRATNRSIAAWRGVGAKYWPIARKYLEKQKNNSTKY